MSNAKFWFMSSLKSNQKLAPDKKCNNSYSITQYSLAQHSDKEWKAFVERK